jgi:hypothetical protein
MQLRYVAEVRSWFRPFWLPRFQLGGCNMSWNNKKNVSLTMKVRAYLASNKEAEKSRGMKFLLANMSKGK